MSLTLVTGRANAGKTGPLYAAIEASLERAETPVLLLPTDPDVRRARGEFARLRRPGVLITTLDRWVSTLWELHGDGTRLVEPGVRAALVDRALGESELEVLRASSRYPGLAELVSSVARAVPPGAEVVSAGAPAEMLRVVRAYQGLLAENDLVEAVHAAQLLSERAPEVGGTVVANRFDDLSVAQETLLCGLARTNEVLIGLTWEEGFPATTALDGLVSRLELACESRLHVPTGAARTPLEAFEAALYRGGPALQPTEAVQFGLAAGMEAECALVARLAAEAVAAGTAPDRIAVVFPNVASRLSALLAALGSERLDVDADVALPFGSTPLGKSVLAAIDSVRIETASRERALAFLQSPYAGAPAEVVSAADSRWRAYRKTGADLVADLCGRDAPAGPLLREIRTLVDGRITPASARDWQSLTARLIANAHLVRGLHGEEGALDAAAQRMLMRVLDEFAAVEGVFGGGDLHRALAKSTLATGSLERPGRVQVTEARRLRSRRFDVIIIGGLTGAEFSIEDDRSLTSALQRELGGASGAEERLRNRMLFYLLTTRAREKVVLVRQATGSSGEERAAAVAFDEARDVYRDASDPECPDFGPDVTVHRIRLHDLAAAAPAYGPGRRTARGGAGRCRPRLPNRGVVYSVAALEKLAATEEFSVSELETYLKCPYSWFFDRAVRPSDIDSEVDAAEVGSRTHRILQQFYRAWREDRGHERVTPPLLADALEVLADADARVHAEARVSAAGLAEELALAKASRWARQVVEDDATFLPGFIPVEHEFRFGSAVERPVSLGGISLKGSIDRIDRRDGRIVVTDYKSSSSVYGHGSFATYALLQIPAYGVVAAELLGDPLAGGLYRSLSTLSARGFWDPDFVEVGEHGCAPDACEPSEIEAVTTAAEEAISAAAAGIRSGDIAQRPYSSRACQYCGARTICEEAR